ncbi:CBS domain-containing protein [Trichloromonas sp.]|uniref:CBS domain-containing protein n=1 Tax=Trichloromonas sp. TaxID=3069249 RepID=UPI003D817E5F
MEVITTHVNSDFDCLGAMIAARKLYPQAEMVFAGSQERSLRAFFLKSAFYAHNFKRVRDIELDAVTRLILVDVRQSSRIGPFAAVAERDGVELHIYDHHPLGAGDLRGTLECIEPVGATVTVFAHLFIERGIVPSPEEATLMMLGLYEDTGSLLFSSTTVRDFQAAAFLLSHGANLNTVADFLTQELTTDQVALLNELINTSTLLNVNGVDVTLAHASVDHFVGDLAVLAHKLRDMESLDALIIAVRMEDRIFIVGRSRIPEVPMGKILAELGGGGHAYAASATVRDMTLIQVLERFPTLLLHHVNPRWKARHLMSAPVKTISDQATIGDVRQILTRYGFSALPVVSAEGTVVGIITRQVAEKAAHHQLSQVSVQKYMSGEFQVVAPDAPAELLKELIVGHNQRFVPVMDKGALVGAITRTDLLRHMVSGVRSAPITPFGSEPATHRGGIKRRQVQRLLREQLSDEMQAILKQCGEVGDDLQVSIFAVGGFVRDLLLRQDNLDVDIVVEGDGIAFAQEFARRYDCRVRAHHKFGTAIVIFPQGYKLDIASARMEYYLEPGALPTVEHSSIKLDLYRRDFTINTLAIALNGKEYGELLDFFSGQRDLNDKVLRVLHNLSFVEDPTRVFRAIRFEQRLGFHLGSHTDSLLRSAVQMGFMDKVGGSRVFNELTIIFKEANPLPAVFRMAELDLLQCIHPSLSFNERKRRIFEAASQAVLWYEFQHADEDLQRWQVYFLCLFADLEQAAIHGISRRLDIPVRFQELFRSQRSRAHQVLRQLARRHGSATPPKPSELYRWLHPLSSEALLYIMARIGEDEVRRWVSRFVTHMRQVKPLLDGHDLRRLGIPPGPCYKKILDALLEARLNGKVVSFEDEIALIDKRFRPSAKQE